MKLRVIGPRVHVRPIWPQELPTIAEANPDPPTLGEVIAVGQARCRTCDEPIAHELRPGMLVRWQPGTVVDAFEFNDEQVWILRIRDVLVEEVRQEQTA